MANESRFTLRHGESVPPKGALLPYELGYTDTGELYIGLPKNTDDTINTNKLLVPTGLSELPTSVNSLSSELNKIKEDLPNTYLGISAMATSAEKDDKGNVISSTYAKLDENGQVLSAKTATKATQDNEGNTISSTYAKLDEDGKVESAKSATKDSEENIISSTYLKLSGGALTGSLSLPILILSTDSYGTSTPDTGVEGQIYFVRETT